MTNQEKYRLLCESESSIPLFNQAWWLDAVVGANWDVCLVEKGGSIHAAMPYVTTSKYGFTLISQPPLTQHLGPWIKELESKYSTQLSRQKELFGELIEQLPKYDSFKQNWHLSQTNWLPFYWRGFQQSTGYTYRIESLVDLDAVWAELQENIRREIRKAKNKSNLVVRSDLPLSEFLVLNRKTFRRQGMELPYEESFVRELVNAAQERKQCRWFVAKDTNGRNHAGVLIVWDHQSAYYLMGGGDPELRQSGAASLCMWEAIRFASTVSRKFDFEGSMIEQVERFFRAFGAKQTPYLILTHRPSKALRAVRCLKNILSSQ